MKAILAKAINNIDWNTPKSVNYLLQHKKDRKAFFLENIHLYLTEVSKLKFYKEKLIDGVRKQKVDLIELNPDFEGDHYVVGGVSKEAIHVARLIDFGHCMAAQPVDYNINKSLSDIRKRTFTQGLKNDYYTVQIITDLNPDGEKASKEKFAAIDNHYKTLDANYKKLQFNLSDGDKKVDIYFYICGPFNTKSWPGLKKSFQTYKNEKGKGLAVFNA